MDFGYSKIVQSMMQTFGCSPVNDPVERAQVVGDSWSKGLLLTVLLFSFFHTWMHSSSDVLKNRQL